MKARTKIGVALLTLLIAVPVFAQQPQTAPISETWLKQLYAALLAHPDDKYTQERIAQEMARIRKLIEVEVKALAESTAAEQPKEGEPPPSALDKERQVISTLQEAVNSWKVDRDLLDAEENKYYQPDSPPPAANDPAKITSSHPELLAKKAILGLRVEVGNSIIDLEQSRLNKLINEQRFAQFGTLINIMKYVLIILLIVILERLVRNVFLSKIAHNTRRYVITKLFTAFIYIITGLWFFSALFAEHPGIITSFAIVGAGIAVALQDVVKDFMGWLIILQGGIFSRGDRISIGAFTGEVVDFTMLRTTLLEVNSGESVNDPLERTGKTMYVPNAKVLTERVLNYHTTSDFTKTEMKVVVALDSNWRKAKEILKLIVTEETKHLIERDRQQHTRRTRHFYIPHEPGDTKMYINIGGNGVEFTLRFTIPIGERREISTRISEKILDTFKKENIELAYTTVRSIPAKPFEAKK